MVCSQATYGSHLPATGRTTPLSPPDVPEVMALGEASESNLEDPDWRIPILEWMVEGNFRLIAQRPTHRVMGCVRLNPSGSSMGIFIGRAR
jgi:hypothetical protein